PVVSCEPVQLLHSSPATTHPCIEKSAPPARQLHLLVMPMQKRTHHEPTKHTAVTNSTCHEATAGGRREAPQHPPTNVTARATKPDAIQRARPREATKPTTTCPANRNYRERATTQRRICKWFDIVGSRHYRQCDRALMTSRHESTSPRGFVALEGSKYGITPRVKLRARPASSQPNKDTSYIQLLNTVLQARQLQRFR